MWVSVLEGQLQRTWWYGHDNRRSTIILYHDTITGTFFFSEIWFRRLKCIVYKIIFIHFNIRFEKCNARLWRDSRLVNAIEFTQLLLTRFVHYTGSLGNSSLLMTDPFHRIPFSISGNTGYIEIKRSGWTGFLYSCFVNDVALCEATQTIASNQDEVVFTSRIIETTFIEDSGDQVSWYVIETNRVEDNVKTIVHRYLCLSSVYW